MANHTQVQINLRNICQSNLSVSLCTRTQWNQMQYKLKRKALQKQGWSDMIQSQIINIYHVINKNHQILLHANLPRYFSYITQEIMQKIKNNSMHKQKLNPCNKSYFIIQQLVHSTDGNNFQRFPDIMNIFFTFIEIYIQFLFISPMYKVLFLSALILSLFTHVAGQCSSQVYFPSAASLSVSCAVINQNDGECSSCNPGYGLLLGQCYPACPSGYTQLMASYCLNDSVVNADQNFELCPTNTTEISSNQCYTPPDSTCTCGPPCPSGYEGIACSCNYAGTTTTSDIENSTSTWSLFLNALLLCGIVFAIGYIGYSLWTRNSRSNPKQMNIEVADYKEMVSERA